LDTFPEVIACYIQTPRPSNPRPHLLKSKETPE